MATETTEENDHGLLDLIVGLGDRSRAKLRLKHRYEPGEGRRSVKVDHRRAGIQHGPTNARLPIPKSFFLDEEDEEWLDFKLHKRGGEVLERLADGHPGRPWIRTVEAGLNNHTLHKFIIFSFGIWTSKLTN